MAAGRYAYAAALTGELLPGTQALDGCVTGDTQGLQIAGEDAPELAPIYDVIFVPKSIANSTNGGPRLTGRQLLGKSVELVGGFADAG